MFGGKRKNSDLHIVFPNQVSEIVYISGKWVTRCHPILMFRGRLVTTTVRFVQWWPISRVIPTGQAKVDKGVFCRTSRSRIPFSFSTQVLTAPDVSRMDRLRIHI